MIRKIAGCALVLLAVIVSSASAGDLILRTRGKVKGETVCARYGWQLLRKLESKRLYLVQAPDTTTAEDLTGIVAADLDVLSVEFSQTLKLPETGTARVQQSIAAILESYGSPAMTDFYGAQVWDLYASQAGLSLIRASEAHERYGVGEGTVAIIDTGVDPWHPALRDAVVSGYDFTRDWFGGSEWPDLQQSIAAILEQSIAAILEQSIAAILEQSVAAILESNGDVDDATVTGVSTSEISLDGIPLPSAFGHGTMVAGLVRAVAPGARILPLKAFRGDGTSNLFDIIAAVYYAADHDVQVINMSFTVPEYSRELRNALAYAAHNGAIPVAAVGNDGARTATFPAEFRDVVGVAATDLADNRAPFSNYGGDVDLAAPGDVVITTYPGGKYAAVAGTSFSTPLVSGTVSILRGVREDLSQHEAAEALRHARKLDPSLQLGAGRLDVLAAAASVRPK